MDQEESPTWTAKGRRLSFGIGLGCLYDVGHCVH